MNCVSAWAKAVGKFWEDILKFTSTILFTLLTFIICSQIFVRHLKKFFKYIKTASKLIIPHNLTTYYYYYYYYYLKLHLWHLCTRSENFFVTNLLWMCLTQKHFKGQTSRRTTPVQPPSS